MSQPNINRNHPSIIPTPTFRPLPASSAAASSRSHYTFGDTSLAAYRLTLLAALFEPSSARLLRRLAYRQPRIAVDLGCGPGWSTRLVHALLAPERTIGLDRSSEQIQRARDTAPPGIDYRVHDITSARFPESPPDFLYCRFLLTHLPDPDGTLSAWAGASTKDATLVIEETAELVCAHPAFERYYQLVDQLQASYGQRLRIGQTLAIPAHGAWKTEVDLFTRQSLPSSRMARVHALNLATWRQDTYARTAFDGDELDHIQARLNAVASGIEDAPPVGQVMRQLVLTRTSNV